ncbi:MAG: phage holin family protein [Thermoleophilaceae bacterium]|nr:phage holin family protein [Thermoleophilaceae bacterium]
MEPIPAWSPERLRLRPVRLLAAWIVSGLAILVAAGIVPGAEVRGAGGAILVAAIVGVLNALLPPLIAALRLPFMVAAGFLLVLALDAAILLIAADIAPEELHVDGFADAFAVSLIAAAVGTAMAALAGIDDDEGYTLRVARRVARRTGRPESGDAPGILFLEIDGLALPVLRRAIRDGNVPNMARWLADGSHRLLEWETDLSSQTGASQAGILLGDNEDIPAFRWVDKESGRVISCSSPDDCAEIERRRTTGDGLLTAGGTSRGNLLSGGADAAILTVSRVADEKRSNPGYRAFLANGNNVTRTFVLFLWEVTLELIAAARQRRRDVHPRGHRGGTYPLLRGGMCVFVRDLVVFSVLQDMFRGVPAIYATFASYDEVAHHSGLERHDTLEALRKLDQRFGLLERARRFAPRPYEIVVLSDHGQTQGATFKQRNGYGLDDLVERSLSRGEAGSVAAGDENATGMARAMDEATGRGRSGARDPAEAPKSEAIVLGSGNLGLVYLMSSPHRLTLEQIDERHPELIAALRSHPHVGFLLVRSAADGALAIGAEGTHRLSDGEVTGVDPLTGFSPNAARHLLRTDGFPHVADIMVNSFYDPVSEEGCAFEELISFHGGMGGYQTQPFLFYPAHFEEPHGSPVGAEAVHRLLRAWRRSCNDGARPLEADVPAPLQSRPA